jgi:hypothetical protein
VTETKRLDGRHYIAQMVEILNRVSGELPGLAGQLDATQIPVWQGQIKALVDDAPIIVEKLFVKTQGGTDLAKEALAHVQALEAAVEQGIKGLSPAEATTTVGAAMEVVNKELGFFIHKAKTTIIRMT